MCEQTWPTSSSFFSCSFLMLFLNDVISPSMAISFSFHCRVANSVADNCSSHLSICSSELRHFCSSAFFSVRMMSISRAASSSVAAALAVSFCCASSCEEYL